MKIYSVKVSWILCSIVFTGWMLLALPNKRLLEDTVPYGYSDVVSNKGRVSCRSLDAGSSVERWLACLPTMFRACAEAHDEPSAERVLSVMCDAGRRQHQRFISQFNDSIAEFFGKCFFSIFFVYSLSGWWRSSVVRTSVFGRQTFPDLCSIYGWQVGKLSIWVSQLGQLSLPSLWGR